MQGANRQQHTGTRQTRLKILLLSLMREVKFSNLSSTIYLDISNHYYLIPLTFSEQLPFLQKKGGNFVEDEGNFQ